FSQGNKEKIKELINQGIALNDSGKYDLAVDKYKEAIKLDPNSMRAMYELSYTLAHSGKPKEAIPYLEKTASADGYAEAYDLLASIYDDEKNFDMAVSYYKQGITAFPKFQLLHFNLAISYLRQKKYADAEGFAINAIKLNPTHPGSLRAYALCAYYQNRGVKAILAFCSFIMREPQSKRAVEAYQYIQKIIQSKVGVKTDKDGKQSVNIYVSDDKALDEDEKAMDLFLSMTAADPALEKNKDKQPVQIFTGQLESIFKIGGELLEKRKQKDFFWNFYVDYYYKLALSDNMEAFGRIVSMSAYPDENVKWINEHVDKLKALKDWMSATPREF
ncbi:MAG: tetratricopeptide repeat protein, partial [Mucilaginibacter sp.]